MTTVTIESLQENETYKLAKLCAKYISQNKFKIYLSGDIGAGKTIFIRGFIQAYGYCGYVKSPTFTILEEYKFKDIKIYHFDLYRIQHISELETIGIRDYLENGICLIEWAEKAISYLSPPDLSISIKIKNKNRRIITFSAQSQQGLLLLNIAFVQKR